jgi:hypothetical protein
MIGGNDLREMIGGKNLKTVVHKDFARSPGKAVRID